MSARPGPRASYETLAADIAAAELAARNAAEAVDITLPGTPNPTGGLHPITPRQKSDHRRVCRHGFQIYEGPEIEDDDHNFTRLNVPKNHPARDMQDTFYVAEDIVLRTQTSGGQIRVMDAQRPPIKVLVPGRVFRSDSDATHSPMFHQMEGLVVDRNITLCDLQGMLTSSSSPCSGPRSRPGCVRPTSPSPSPASRWMSPASNAAARAAACASIPAGSRCWAPAWVHHNVLRNCGIDPEVYSGFAFGIGIERIAIRAISEYQQHRPDVRK